MISYLIYYKVRGNETLNSEGVKARDLKSAKKKLGKKHGYKDGRMIQVERVSIIGYY